MTPLFAALLFQAAAASPSLDQILWRVALNQARAQDARTSYVYSQRVRIRLRKPNGALMRDEDRLYRIAPGARGVDKQLIQLQGRYARGGGFISYDKADFQYKAIDLDGALAQGFADGFTNDPESRDGIAHDLFPLTAHEQLKYLFALKERERYQDRDVYRIAFRPRPHTEGNWTGEALVDVLECQPVFVQTRLARGIPVAVRTLLGSNVRGLGFSIAYRKVDDIWFPATYGGEFSLRVLFGYKRNISIDLTNSDFVRTHVDSAIRFEQAPAH
jgi:hypothetical protein